MLLQFAAIWSISLYAIPLVATFIYQRNYSLTDNAACLSKLAAGAGALLIASLAARSYSRINNPAYVKFVQTLAEAYSQYNEKTKQELHKYDFEFSAWPVDFDVSELQRLDLCSFFLAKTLRILLLQLLALLSIVNVFSLLELEAKLSIVVFTDL